jgi:hypothetical protein
MRQMRVALGGRLAWPSVTVWAIGAGGGSAVPARQRPGDAPCRGGGCRNGPPSTQAFAGERRDVLTAEYLGTAACRCLVVGMGIARGPLHRIPEVSPVVCRRRPAPWRQSMSKSGHP